MMDLLELAENMPYKTIDEKHSKVRILQSLVQIAISLQ